MYLKEITLQGFKTFAKKTHLSFLPPSGDTHAITAIVGPNGSGKSNIADAIRWVLGEQRMTALRSKNASDVIFSGSNEKTRAGFAEVEVTFGDVQGIEDIDFSEVTLARRLYRDGESTYMLNGQQARLLDIQMLLAQANVGQRSYSIVGQGQIDHILAATPEERKMFFDDATGVKPLQLKRHQAVLKLRRTRDNLEQAELLVQELTPRLRTLKRLVRRLDQREVVETELREAQTQYYGTLWNTLHEKLKAELSGFSKTEAAVKKQQAVLDKERLQFDELEKEEEARGSRQEAVGAGGLQKQYDELQEERARIRNEQFELHKKLELAKVKSSSTWAPLPLTKIIDALGGLKTKIGQAKKRLMDNKLTIEELDALLNESKGLLQRLQKPAPEEQKPDPGVTKQLTSLEKREAEILAELEQIKSAMQSAASDAKKERKSFFDLQRRLLSAQESLHTLESQLNDRRVTLARLETRREDLEKEMEEVLGNEIAKARAYKDGANTDELYPKIQQLRHKLDLIGGIDEETVSEFEEAQERHTFLEEQIADLVEALRDTEKIIEELDEQIKTQSKKAFKEIQQHFEHYFKILFGGGTCALKEIKEKDLVGDKRLETGDSEESEDDSSNLTSQIPPNSDRVIGIEITATPPGKRLKSINLLSGGERALTSIALISAIMATNPSPFVVLDEVDAALDEANTYRFAKIIEDLQKHTQFVIITHNRATMHAADVLYGVTMQKDGVSQLISVKIEEVEKSGTARR